MTIAEAAPELDTILTRGTDPVENRANQLRVDEEARAIVKRERAVAAMNLPPERESYTLTSYAAETRPPRVMRIEDFQGERHLTVLGAMFKTGKTTLTANLARSFVDGEPFLNAFKVTRPRGAIGFFNAEMEDEDFEEYLFEAGVANTDAVVIWHLRGYSIDLLSDVGRDVAVTWLRENDVAYWVLDPWAYVCAWCGVNEESNPEVAPLVQRVFEIAEQAGVDNTLIVHHSGWDGNRLRGATALPAAADTLWQYTQDDDGVREIRAFGRGIPETRGVVKLTDGRLTFTGQTRRVAKRESAAEVALEYVRDNPGTNKTDAYDLMPFGRDKNTKAVKAALKSGLIVEAQDGRQKILTVNPSPPDQPDI